MIYRQATDADQELLSMMEAEGIESSPPGLFWRAEENVLGRLISLEHVFVAEQDGDLLGMLGAFPAGKHHWYVSHFYVRPKFQGNGIGRGLMRTAARYHEGFGRSRAFATPNPSAIGAYEKMGFKKIATTMEWQHAE